MKLSKIFEEKPEQWGFRGDPYFWDYLKERAEHMELLSPDELEAWIKEEYRMSSGGVDNSWWMEEGIPLLKSRLKGSGKNHELYLKQKALLKQFLSTGAISQAQYDKSFHDLTEKMQEGAMKHEYVLYLPIQSVPVKQRTAFFNELHELDVKAYSKEYAGEAITMEKRYAANTESLIFVRDLAIADEDHPKGRVVGYMNFFPVDQELQEKILNKETPFNEIDDGILPESITAYEDGSFIFLLSFVIDKKYRDGEVVKMMTDALKEFLEEKKKEGKLGNIAACACTEAGKKNLADIGMKRHHALKEDREKEVYVAI